MTPESQSGDREMWEHTFISAISGSARAVGLNSRPGDIVKAAGLTADNALIFLHEKPNLINFKRACPKTARIIRVRVLHHRTSVAAIRTSYTISLFLPLSQAASNDWSRESTTFLTTRRTSRTPAPGSPDPSPQNFYYDFLFKCGLDGAFPDVPPEESRVACSGRTCRNSCF